MRNSFLQGAYELRNGLPGGTPQRSTGPDVACAMSTELWLDFLGISMDPKKADGMRFTINLVTQDNGEKYVVEMSNATLTNIKGEQAKNADLTITLNRADLNMAMMGATSFDDLIKAGKATFDGDRKPFEQLRGLFGLVHTGLRDLARNRSEEADEKASKPFEVPELGCLPQGANRLTGAADLRVMMTIAIRQDPGKGDIPTLVRNRFNSANPPTWSRIV